MSGQAENSLVMYLGHNVPEVVAHQSQAGKEAICDCGEPQTGKISQPLLRVCHTNRLLDGGLFLPFTAVTTK